MRPAMKKRLFLLLALVLPMQCLRAQDFALGAKVPELKVDRWMENRSPQEGRITCVEFFSAANPSNAKSLKWLKQLIEISGGRLQVVVVTRDAEEKAAPLLKPNLSPNLTVAFDADGRNFESFGVRYVPFCMVIDRHNRLLWQGNPLRLNEAQLRLILSSTK